MGIDEKALEAAQRAWHEMDEGGESIDMCWEAALQAGLDVAKSSEQPVEFSLDDEISLERDIAAELASYYVGGKPEEYLKVACGVRILLHQRGLLKREVVLVCPECNFAGPLSDWDEKIPPGDPTDIEVESSK